MGKIKILGDVNGDFGYTVGTILPAQNAYSLSRKQKEKIMTHLLTYVPIPMPLPIHNGCSGTSLPPISSGFMTGAFVCVFLSLLILIIAILRGCISDKYINPAFMVAPLLLGLICIGIALVCAIFGL